MDRTRVVIRTTIGFAMLIFNCLLAAAGIAALTRGEWAEALVALVVVLVGGGVTAAAWSGSDSTPSPELPSSRTPSREERLEITAHLSHPDERIPPERATERLRRSCYSTSLGASLFVVPHDVSSTQTNTSSHSSTDADDVEESGDFIPSADELVAGNRRFAAAFEDHDLQVTPTRRMAVVTCMDSRMDIFALLGLGHGEAHIIRNAGGVITDDVIRSLCLSQRYLGTREIVLVHHTDCGLQMVTEHGLREELAAEIGVKPWWAVESFDDPYVDVRQSMKRLEMTPFVPFKEHVRGFVYDVSDGRLVEVAVDAAPTT